MRSSGGFLGRLIDRVLKWWLVARELAAASPAQRQAIVDLLFAAAFDGAQPSQERLRLLPVQLLRLPWMWDEPAEQVQRRLAAARRAARTDRETIVRRCALELADLRARDLVVRMVAELSARDAGGKETLSALGRELGLPDAAREERAARYARAPQL